MAEFRKWLEDNPHGQSNFPSIKLLPQIDTKQKWVEPAPLSGAAHLLTYYCENCSNLWQVPKGLGKPSSCPRCSNFSLIELGRLREPS